MIALDTRTIRARACVCVCVCACVDTCACVLVAIRLIMQRPLNELHVMASHRLPGTIIVEEQLGLRDIENCLIRDDTSRDLSWCFFSLFRTLLMQLILSTLWILKSMVGYRISGYRIIFKWHSEYFSMIGLNEWFFYSRCYIFIIF